ncbi:DUF308 domain-containing protein [Lacticaseibacillus baoqingensis]|uniref:DUF308 domain-containing protein n=1 Tax=Lacticaseibacillus baoqingensis TaxID=2486013 RepID=A0ABW4ECN3_9LACO|nr:DUF308 domain-containing protein [Lacticaseibacillus baoqingensis]
MHTKVTRVFKNVLVRSLSLLLVGLWFLLLPQTVYTVVKWVLVAGLLVMAAPALIQGLKARHAATTRNWALTRGLALLVAALLVAALLRPVMSLLPVTIGIFVILFGLNKIATAKADKQYVNVSAVPQILYGVIVIIAGGILLFNPFHAIMVLVQVTGGMMLVMAVMEVVTAVRAPKA